MRSDFLEGHRPHTMLPADIGMIIMVLQDACWPILRLVARAHPAGLQAIWRYHEEAACLQACWLRAISR